MTQRQRLGTDTDGGTLAHYDQVTSYNLYAASALATVQMALAVPD